MLSRLDAKKTERLFCQCKEFKAQKVEEKRKEGRTKLELELEVATLLNGNLTSTYSCSCQCLPLTMRAPWRLVFSVEYVP